MDVPQALREAGLDVKQQEDGTRLVVRDVDTEGCAIRSRGGHALADLLAGDRRIRALDLREANFADDGLGQLCLRLRQTDQLEELNLGAVGHSGLTFLTSAINRCDRLKVLTFEVCDTPTLHAVRQSQAASDFDTSAYQKAPPKGGAADSEGEEEDADAEEDGEGEDVAARKEKQRLEELAKLLKGTDYDSDEEQVGNAAGDSSRAAPAEPGDAPKGASGTLLGLLQDFVDTVDKKQNLFVVECKGEAIPADLQLDLHRAAARHQEAAELKMQAKAAKGARTANDALRDQMEELRNSLEQAPNEGGDDTTRLGIRSFVSRRLFAAIGEALFECQRFKSKDNAAVSTPEGEMAFVSMYLRKHAAKFSSGGVAKRGDNAKKP